MLDAGLRVQGCFARSSRRFGRSGLVKALSPVVRFEDGVVRACLVPVAGLLNHATYAHVYHYSVMQGGQVSLRAMRPCQAGEQIFLSYGPLPNEQVRPDWSPRATRERG
eukprot:1195489-Prorocentrum_minimum.AAC.1